MIIGTWKPEPASEEAWEVDWTMDELNPEYVDEEAYNQFLDQQHKQNRSRSIRINKRYDKV